MIQNFIIWIKQVNKFGTRLEVFVTISTSVHKKSNVYHIAPNFRDQKFS